VRRFGGRDECPLWVTSGSILRVSDCFRSSPNIRHHSARSGRPFSAISRHLGPGRLRSACFFMRPPQRLGSSIPPRR
jgi:hypothetical protein